MANWKWLKRCIEKIEASLIDLILPIEYLTNVHHLGNVHMTCKEGQFDAVELMLKIKLLKIGLEENRKTLKRPKMMSKTNFTNLKLKSDEEYLICRTYFVLQKT